MKGEASLQASSRQLLFIVQADIVTAFYNTQMPIADAACIVKVCHARCCSWQCRISKEQGLGIFSSKFQQLPLHRMGQYYIALTHGPRLDNIFLQCAPPLSVILQCQRKTDAFLIARSVHVFVSLIWLSGKQLKYVARFGSEYLTVLPSCFRGCSAFSLSS